MQDQENTQAQENQDTAPAEELKTAAAEAAAEKPVENVAPGEPTLEQQLANAVAKAAELQDAYLRAKAEGENIRRRAQEDIAKAHKFAVENFAESMMPVRDSLEMALLVATPTMESLKEGVDMTLKQLTAAFEKNKLVEVNPQPGDKLDPMKHQAVSMVPAEQAANTVVNVLQKGYMISDRLLRPALVTVAQ
jgi:molecular chaperone GrpE